MLTKTVNGETTEFEYNNEWLDQLTAVNGTSLTYDINGNLLTYGDAEYTWSRGRLLDSITDGENSYSYTYDTNGVRTSKKVNGRTTNFNVLGSKILAQESIDGYMYFQYSGDELIGFHLDDAQYFYVKNLNGDIVGITDYDGNLIAEYEYDEWGKLLNITTAEEIMPSSYALQTQTRSAIVAITTILKQVTTISSHAITILNGVASSAPMI